MWFDKSTHCVTQVEDTAKHTNKCMPFRFCDAFSGIGGASAGAMEAGCKILMGIEIDDKILRPYATNTGGQAVCATIGKDKIPWPDAAPDVMIHLSPPCTALSKARAGSASEARRCMREYKSWDCRHR